jgi:hypothetical protein
MAPPSKPPSPIVVWSRRDFVEEHGGAFAGILPGGLGGPLMFGLLLYCFLRILIHEHFPTANMLTVQQKSRLWQRHIIGLDVRHAVMLPEFALSLQKE